MRKLSLILAVVSCATAPSLCRADRKLDCVRGYGGSRDAESPANQALVRTAIVRSLVSSQLGPRLHRL